MKSKHLLTLTINLLFCLNLSYGYIRCKDIQKNGYRFVANVINGGYRYKMTILAENFERSVLKFSDFAEFHLSWRMRGIKPEPLLNNSEYVFPIELFCDEYKPDNYLSFKVLESEEPFSKKFINYIVIPQEARFSKKDNKAETEYIPISRYEINPFLLGEIEQSVATKVREEETLEHSRHRRRDMNAGYY